MALNNIYKSSSLLPVESEMLWGSDCSVDCEVNEEYEARCEFEYWREIKALSIYDYSVSYPEYKMYFMCL